MTTSLPRTIRLTALTSPCCPAQWDGVTDDGRTAYIRYRWGWLSVRVSATGDAVGGDEIVGAQLGDRLDGSLTTDQLFTALHEAGITLLEA